MPRGSSNDLTLVSVCVSSPNGAVNIEDVETPSDALMREKLREQGLDLADPDAMATESDDDNVEV